MTTINPKASSDKSVFRAELLRVLADAAGVTARPAAAFGSDELFCGEALRLFCSLLEAGGVGGGVGSPNPFAAMTPAEVSDLSASILAQGGTQYFNAFGQPIGVIIPN